MRKVYSPTGTYFADALVALCGGRLFRLFVVGRLRLFAWTFGVGAYCDPFSGDVIALIQCVYCSINNIVRFVCVTLLIYGHIQSIGHGKNRKNRWKSAKNHGKHLLNAARTVVSLGARAHGSFQSLGYNVLHLCVRDSNVNCFSRSNHQIGQLIKL